MPQSIRVAVPATPSSVNKVSDTIPPQLRHALLRRRQSPLATLRHDVFAYPECDLFKVVRRLVKT